MTDTKHTPGPWTHEDGDRYVREEATGGPVALVCADDGHVSHPTSLPQTANARLIAAGPDMLEALRAAKQVLETASRYFPKSIKNSDRFSLLNVLANAIDPAITKATGATA